MIFPVRYVGIILQGSIMGFLLAMDVRVSSRDRYEEIVNTSAKQNLKGVAWWIKRIGINVGHAA